MLLFPQSQLLRLKKKAAKQLAAARKISQKEITEIDRVSLQLLQNVPTSKATTLKSIKIKRIFVSEYRSLPILK